MFEAVVYLINQGVRLSDYWINENATVYNNQDATEALQTFLKKIHRYIESENKVNFIRTKVLVLENENLKSDLLETILLFECAAPSTLGGLTSILRDYDIRNQIIPDNIPGNYHMAIFRYLYQMNFAHTFGEFLKKVFGKVTESKEFKGFKEELKGGKKGKRFLKLIKQCKKEFNRKEKLKLGFRDCSVVCE